MSRSWRIYNDQCYISSDRSKSWGCPNFKLGAFFSRLWNTLFHTRWERAGTWTREGWRWANQIDGKHWRISDHSRNCPCFVATTDYVALMLILTKKNLDSFVAGIRYEKVTVLHLVIIENHQQELTRTLTFMQKPLEESSVSGRLTAPS